MDADDESFHSGNEEMDEDDEEVEEKGEPEEHVVDSKPATNNEDVVDDLSYDLYNLSATNYHPIEWKKDSKRESNIMKATLRAAQLLYNK
jgi:hypothetical protein